MSKKTAIQKAIEDYSELGCTIEVILLNKRLPKTLRDQLATDSSNFYYGLKHLRDNEEKEQLIQMHLKGQNTMRGRHHIDWAEAEYDKTYENNAIH